MNRREPNSKFIIFGDFNIPCIDWFQENDRCIALTYEGRMANELLNTLTCTNLSQQNHIKNQYNKTLDLILTNKPKVKCKRTNGIVKEDPYHPALSMSFDFKDIKFMRMKNRTKLNFYKANYQAIENEICSIDWHNKLGNLGVEIAVTEYYKIINTIIHKHTPKTKPTTDIFPIWYSRDLIRLLNEKEKLFQLKKNNPAFIQIFKDKRKEVKLTQKKCLKEYEMNIESKMKTNPKCFFAYTKSLQKTNCLPLIMKYKNQTSENMKDTANLFANYFSSVYSDSNYPPQFPMHKQQFRLSPIIRRRYKKHNQFT